MKLILNGHKVISWNAIYSSPHWIKRRAIADEIHELVWAEAIAQKIKRVKSKDYPLMIKIYAWQKGKLLDADNIFAKGYIDGLKLCGVIKDDSPKYIESVETASYKGKVNKVVIGWF